jgi:hypothetical protein
MNKEDSTESREEEQEKESEALDISPKIMGIIAVVLALPVDIYITHHGDGEKGIAAAIFIAATFATVMFRWKLRRMWWFWTTIVAIAFVEFFLIQRIPWYRYRGNLPPVSLLPLALVISALQFGCVALVRKIMSGNSREESDGA